ncbi:MAG: VWA domain-containing protein [Bryobacterales bacterium]|nr:VWA domain-containing protein [Bryobacterales bacterium]
MSAGRISLALLLVAGAVPAADDVVFRSDVSLIRVDVQVLDRQNRTITGLHQEDFVLREEGQTREIRNFASEEVPLDVVLLLDVSRSMRPHIERIAAAANEAMLVLGRQDRVGIMVFDRQVRTRMRLRQSVGDLGHEMRQLLDDEDFNGGTDITRALYEAGRYLGREARREARRAIVIVTDDQTERGRDEAGVTRALTASDVVLSAIISPDALRSARGGGGMGRGGGVLDDIIFGRRYPRQRTPVSYGTRSAGTSEIARRTGGDSLRIDDADALETTLSRIRQRYALHFYLPDGVKPSQERKIDVELAAAARRRYPDADVRYRNNYLTPTDAGSTVSSAPPTEAPVTVASGDSADRSPAPQEEEPRLKKRRPAVDETYGSRSGPGPASDGVWRRSTDPEPPRSEPKVATPAGEAERKGGWRKATPEDLKP